MDNLSKLEEKLVNRAVHDFVNDFNHTKLWYLDCNGQDEIKNFLLDNRKFTLTVKDVYGNLPKTLELIKENTINDLATVLSALLNNWYAERVIKNKEEC